MFHTLPAATPTASWTRWPALVKQRLLTCHIQHLFPRSYTDYILDTLAKRELFQWLSLTPAKFWHTLLWKDRWARG